MDPVLDNEALTYTEMSERYSQQGQGLTNAQLREHWQNLQPCADTLALGETEVPVPPDYDQAVNDYNELWDDKAELRGNIEYQTFYVACQSEEAATQRLQEVASAMHAMRRVWKSSGKDIVSDAKVVWQPKRGRHSAWAAPSSWPSQTSEEKEYMERVMMQLAIEDGQKRAWDIQIKCLEEPVMTMRICKNMTGRDLKHRINWRTRWLLKG